ncbi:MAG: zinc-ribbon domain-containing protein [Sulfuricurvum sp.]|nr:zinc-ribbon domain-containing protein [Sulfuricurvum sp.]
MSMIKCIECGEEISTDAKTCPKCGTSKPHKNKGQMIAVAVIAVITFAVAMNYTKTKEPINGEALTKEANGKPAIMTPNEVKIYKSFIQDDLSVYADGGDSMITSLNIIDPLPIQMTINHLQKEYEKNEVSADGKYRKKAVIVKGKVSSIDRSIGDNYLIMFHGGSNEFMHPSASMESDQTEYLSKLNKGDQISLSCNVSGMLMGTVSLNHCIPANVWASDVTDKIVNATGSLVDNGDKRITDLVKFSKLYASKLNPDSKCFSGDNKDECMKEIANIKFTDDEKKSIKAQGAKN